MGQIGRFICPSCHAVNVQDGNCFKCGADLMRRDDFDPGSQQRSQGGGQSGGSADSEDADEGYGQDRGQSQWQQEGSSLRGMQSGGFPLTKKQMILAGGLVLLLVSMIMMMGGGGGNQSTTPPPATTSTAPDAEQKGNLEAASALAEKYAAFNPTLIPDWSYVDTSELTGAMPSFGLNSEKAGTKIVFVVWDNQGPVDNLELILKSVPFTSYTAPSPTLVDVKVDKGTNFVGKDSLVWFVGKYPSSKDGKLHLVLVGAYKSPVAGKAIVFIAEKLTKEDPNAPPAPPPAEGVKVIEVVDYRNVLFLVDTMTSEYTARLQGIAPKKAESAVEEEKTLATPEELTAYCNEIQSRVAGKFKPVKDDDVESDKVVVDVGITEDGKVTKLEISESSHNEKIDQAVLTALTNAQPFKAAPHTAKGSIEMRVTAEKGKITVEQQ